MSLAAEHPIAEGALRRPTQVASLTLLPVTGPEWDRQSARFDGICQEQLFAFAKVRWPTTEHQPVLFLWGGEIVGGTLMMIQKLPLGLGGIAVSKWGPVFADETRPDFRVVCAAAIEALIEEFAVRRGLMISMLPRASLTEPGFESGYLAERGFKPGSTLLFPNRYIVNLRLSDAEQRKSFAQKWRYHLNKSEKANLVFEHATPERIGEFDRLYQAMTDRKKFPDHSAYETVPALMAIEDETLRPELFFVREGGEVIAGAIIFKAGNRAVYLYGATVDRALPLRAGYFMHWHIIRWLRDNTLADWYDLGGTDGFQGLHQFKKGMVGDRGVISPVPPVANYAAKPLAYWLGTGAFAARDLLHQVRRVVDNYRSDRAKPDLAPHGQAEVE